MKKQNEFILINFIVLIVTFLIFNIQNIDTDASIGVLEIISLMTSFLLCVLYYLYLLAIKTHLYYQTKLKIRNYLNAFDIIISSIVLVILYMVIKTSSYTIAFAIVLELALTFLYLQRMRPYILEITNSSNKNNKKNKRVSNNLEDYDDLTLGEASQYGINNVIALKQAIFNEFMNNEVGEKLINLNYKDCKITNISEEDKVLNIDAVLKVSYIDKHEKHSVYKINLSKSSIMRRSKVCPNCGQSLKTTGTDKCPYCKTIIVSSSDTLVINKITKTRS